jgi:hypothetical protein
MYITKSTKKKRLVGVSQRYLVSGALQRQYCK